MSANHAWLLLLHDVLSRGVEVAPRGKLTLEIPQHTIEVDMLRPVVTVVARRLSHQFMSAEAFWILTGDDTTAGIVPFNKNVLEYSDDGVTFFGAYGPRVVDQIQFVVSKLLEDASTRQAVLTTWRQNPPKSKDIPCTIAMAFNLRGGWLNAHVFMRSSDVWLGIPYDVFSFSMVAHLICTKYNEACGNPRAMKPGKLYLTAASSHLYETNWTEAKQVYASSVITIEETPVVPDSMWMSTVELMKTLEGLRTTKRGDALRWWEL